MYFVNEGYIEEIYGRIIIKGYNLRWKADYTTDKPTEEETESIIYEGELFVERINKGIKGDTMNEEQSIKEFFHALKSKYIGRIKKIILFGSYARGIILKRVILTF